MATTAKGITYPVGSDTADLATHFYNLATSADSAIGSYVGSTRNYIINGGFDVWQRGTSFTTINTYTADRWRAYLTTDTFTATRQTLTNGDIPGRFTYFYRMSNTTAGSAGSFTAIQQRIESARTLAGQSVVVSFWAKSNTAAPVFVEFERNHGTGGSPSAVSYHSLGATSNLTGSWVRYSVTGSITSLAGITLGTNGDDYLALNIFTSAGSAIGHSTGLNTFGTRSAQVDIAGVQVELGTVATPYEFRPIGTETELCYRYYYKIVGGSGVYLYGPGACQATTTWYSIVTLPVPMRKEPTQTVSAASDFRFWIIMTGNTCSAFSPNYAGSNTIAMATWTATSGTGGDYRWLSNATANSWYAMDAEL